MDGQVGYWGSGVHGGLVIGFGPEMMEWLAAQDCGRRVFASVTRERRVVVIPDAEGGYVKSSAAHGHSRFLYVSCSKPDSLFMDVEVPPFELHRAEFAVEEGCISHALVEDYELPWPRLHLDCSTYEAEQLAVEALQWRLNSLFASGLTRFPKDDQRMPQRLHRLMPRGKYAECLATARALASGGKL